MSKEITAGKITGSVVEDRIREIVREEIAAHEERLIEAVKESLHHDVTEFLAATENILDGTSK